MLQPAGKLVDEAVVTAFLHRLDRQLGADPAGARLWVDANVDAEVAQRPARHLATFASAALAEPDAEGLSDDE